MPDCRCPRCEADRSILGLHQFATFHVVTRSYKDLVKVWHPDRFENDARLRLKAEEEFKRIQQAFTSLKEHEIETPAQERPEDRQPTEDGQPSGNRAPVPPPTIDATFFSTSLLKLSVLSLCTFGLYQLYWFYRNWQAIRRRTGASISPFWRTVFTPLFCYQCFKFIAQDGRRRGLSRSPAAGILATAWIVGQAASRLPDPCWLITVGSVVFLLPIQAYANRILAIEVPGFERNSRFSLWNWLTVAVGGCVFALATVGTFLPNK